MSIQGKPGRLSRKAFIGLGGGTAAALMLGGKGKGPLQVLGAQAAEGQTPSRTAGYGPLTPKGDLALPPEFNYQRISQQGKPMSDGNPTPGIFDGMGAFPGGGRDDDDGDRTTILIRNHENRERPGEIPVVVPPEKAYDYPATIGGDTKLVVSRRRRGRNPDGSPRYVYTVERDFAILGGTSTNCAGGLAFDRYWLTCEEVVKGPSLEEPPGSQDPNIPFPPPKKHGYIFPIDAYASGPVEAVPIRAAGRFAHEAALEYKGIIYETEDRSPAPDPKLGEIGAVFYRFIPEGYDGDDDGRRSRRGRRSLSDAKGRLEGLKIKGEFHANMDAGREVGRRYPVEWVPVPTPDHDDDTDERRDRQPGFTPTRIQAQDRGAAYFDRQEGMWADDDRGVIYFDCTEGGEQDLGQVWEFDPDEQTLTLVYESQNPAQLENPDNVVIVPQTGDVFLQEDSPGEQYVRGVTPEGEIYDFAMSVTNDTEFCGGCFSPDGSTFYLNQQGERGGPPEGPPGSEAVTYAIYGPFGKRRGDDNEDD